MRRWSNGFNHCPMWVIVPLLAFFLTSCSRPVSVASSSAPVLPFKVAGASDKDVIEMTERLKAHGVTIITLGQDYLVSIPADVLFANQSPRLIWASYTVLNDVACFLKQFRKISVNVTAYSNKCVSPQRERALTLARARKVANYLWSQNVDSRFIFTHGLGSDKPIMAYAAGGDSSTNSRVEITFRDAVA